jgi:hypothetical protein
MGKNSLIKSTPGTAASKKESDPVSRVMKLAAAAFVLLIVLIIFASMSNRHRYYLKATDGAMELWQGDFAPMGNRLINTMPGMIAPKQTLNRMRDGVTSEEVFPLVSSYYLEKADALLDGSAMPDFEGIQSYLGKALQFAITENHRRAVANRLRDIDLMTLVYRADVAASRGTVADLEAAMGFLKKASALDLDDSQARLIKQKTKSIKILTKAAEEKLAEAAAKNASAK